MAAFAMKDLGGAGKLEGASDPLSALLLAVARLDGGASMRGGGTSGGVGAKFPLFEVPGCGGFCVE